MDYTYPEKYFKAVLYFNSCIRNLESTTLLNNEQKLMFYALQKQAENGPCTEAAPSFWNSKELYKHKAWSRLGNMSQFEAMVHFVRQLEEILGGPVNWKEKIGEAEPLSTSITSSTSVEVSSPMDSPSKQLVPPSEWDKDLSEHVEPTPNNIAFMASEVMHARRLCQRLQQLSEKHTETFPVRNPLGETSILQSEKCLDESGASRSPSRKLSQHHLVDNGQMSLPLKLASQNSSQKCTPPRLGRSRQCALEWLSWI
ncbi:unnamed protein product [Phytomonas sp. EM1]|nr:unnamed protein product [Phytomonas sp. EM1]|eukprot:CCW63226.1 unnamed protein product [Phytomonas sp. isolate EM1]